MKKEMMILVDTANKFEDIVSAARYAEHKEELLEKYADVDEYDLGYAAGFTDALTNMAIGVANGNNDEVSEFMNAMEEAETPIDIVTVNSAGHVNEPEDDDDMDEYEKEEYEAELEMNDDFDEEDE